MTRVGSPAGLSSGLHSTPTFRALSHDFCFEVDDAALAAYLTAIWAPLRHDGDGHRYRLARREDLWEVSYDGEVKSTYPAPDTALAYLLWHVNRQVIEREREHLLLHASAAERGGHTVLLPAEAESGKTTLVAGLVRSGLRYVTDEAVAIDVASRQVAPYPKPLSVDPGSWEVLADLEPDVPDGVRPYLQRQWHVPVTGIRDDAIAGVSVPALIVFPRYEMGASTELHRLRRSEAVVQVAQNAFNLHALGRRGFTALTEVVRGCDCYTLVLSDLDEGVAAVSGLLPG